MTREQKIDAFVMRLDGYTLQEIGDKYGITRERIRQILSSICTKNRITRKHYVYPNISTWMQENDVTQTDLSKAIHVAQTTMSGYLTGKFDPSMRFVQLILEKTGMPFEVAFKKQKEAANNAQ